MQQTNRQFEKSKQVCCNVIVKVLAEVEAQQNVLNVSNIERWWKITKYISSMQSL